MSPAHAINECGPAIGGVVTCNTSTYPKGPGTHIEYRIDTGLRATIDSVAVRWADDAGSDRPAIDIRSDKVTSEGDLIVTMEGSTVTTGEPDRIGTRSDREVGEYADGLRVTQRGAGARFSDDAERQHHHIWIQRSGNLRLAARGQRKQQE
ncbi:hypothetical protein Q1M63_23425 [Sinorhizobium meliloti]|nr:hypothetical protein Q1M63_23425 [Sinorhizobium meliloti]